MTQSGFFGRGCVLHYCNNITAPEFYFGETPARACLTRYYLGIPRDLTRCYSLFRDVGVSDQAAPTH